MALKTTQLKINTVRKNSSSEKKFDAILETLRMLEESLRVQKVTLDESIKLLARLEEDDVYNLASMKAETVKNLGYIERCLSKVDTEQ